MNRFALITLILLALVAADIVINPGSLIIA